MATQTYMGIPREEIPWRPIIDADKCTGCGSCMAFCSNGVFKMGATVMEVAKPFNCVVGCSACLGECAFDALSFPTKEVLIQSLRELRAKYANAS